MSDRIAAVTAIGGTSYDSLIFAGLPSILLPVSPFGQAPWSAAYRLGFKSLPAQAC